MQICASRALRFTSHAAQALRFTSHAAQIREGTLYVVATSIGNLRDISLRAAEVLTSVPVIAAESVHTAETLLRTLHHSSAVTIKQSNAMPHIVSYHIRNEVQRVPELLDALKNGEDVALISRVGTPLLRDPGCVLVAAAHRNGFAVQALPGPSSLTAAVSVSGLQADRLLFEGYLPMLRSVRIQRLRHIFAMDLSDDGGKTALAVFCDGGTVDDIIIDAAEVLGPHTNACIAKDITMPFDRVMAASLSELHNSWRALPVEAQRGAIVLLIELPSKAAVTHTSIQPAGRPPPPSSPPPEMHAVGTDSQREVARVVAMLLRNGVPVKNVALLAAQLTGVMVSTAHKVLQDALLGDKVSTNVPDALPPGANSGSRAQCTLHFVNLGPYVTADALAMLISEVGAPKGDITICQSHQGETVAFVRFASPEAAATARTTINLAGVSLGTVRPVMAGWARRERWIT